MFIDELFVAVLGAKELSVTHSPILSVFTYSRQPDYIWSWLLLLGVIKPIDSCLCKKRSDGWNELGGQKKRRFIFFRWIRLFDSWHEDQQLRVSFVTKQVKTVIGTLSIIGTHFFCGTPPPIIESILQLWINKIVCCYSLATSTCSLTQLWFGGVPTSVSDSFKPRICCLFLCI